MPHIGLRDQIEAALAQYDAALAALHTAGEVLVSTRLDLQRARSHMLATRIELRVQRRCLQELHDELTAPATPASRTDIRAAFDDAESRDAATRAALERARR